jgi:hypothetical protein
MDYALSTPLPGLTLLQRLLWPLIFLQLIALRDHMGVEYGRDVPCWISISKFGRARLIHLPTDFTLSDAAPLPKERFDYRYTSGQARAELAATFIEAISPPGPTSVRAIPPAMPQTQSGQAATVHPDTS